MISKRTKIKYITKRRGLVKMKIKRHNFKEKSFNEEAAIRHSSTKFKAECIPVYSHNIFNQDSSRLVQPEKTHLQFLPQHKTGTIKIFTFKHHIYNTMNFKIKIHKMWEFLLSQVQDQHLIILNTKNNSKCKYHMNTSNKKIIRICNQCQVKVKSTLKATPIIVMWRKEKDLVTILKRGKKILVI